MTKVRESAVTTTAGRYAFTPTICAIGVEDGVDDIEIAGAGTAPDGSPIYVEFSSTGNSIDIGLGVDQAFATAEHRLIAGQHVTQPFTVAVSGTTVKATGVSLATDQGAAIDPNASFEADCSPPR